MRDRSSRTKSEVKPLCLKSFENTLSLLNLKMGFGSVRLIENQTAAER